jgi:hypothetical protein
MITEITQFGDWIFANDGFRAGLALNESRGQYAANPTVTTRAGSPPVITQGNLSARVIPVEFDYDPGLDPHGDRGMQEMIDILAGMLDPRDLTPRRLVGARHDGTIVQRMATVSSPDTWSDDQSLNFVRVVFTSDVPEWDAAATTTVGPVAVYADSGAAIPVPNVGLATVEPTITITPGAFSHTTTTADVGWRYRRTLNVINLTGKTWTNRPLQLDLGDTSAWVAAGKALANGNDLRILLDGEDLPRTLVGWNRKKTFAWITPPPIAAGESVSFDVIYGNPSAGAPETLDGKLHPAFVIESDSGTATSGSTTTLNDTTKNWNSPFQDWHGAFVSMLTGANAGLSRAVTSSSGTQLVTAAFPSAIAAGDAYLVALSSNSRWSYALDTLAFPNASTSTRGRWYLNSATKRPRDIDFSVPGAWAPYAMADNSDRFAQTSYSWQLNLPFALLDAYRTWEGGGARGRLTSEDGVADGVWLSSVLPILAYTFDANLSNNLNGMAQAVVMARTSGAEAWEPIDAVTANGPITKTVTLPVDDDYHHLYQGLTPADGEGVIRVDRARDRGTTSSDGSTRTSVTTSSQTLRKGPSSSADSVKKQDNTTVVTVPSGTTVERDGRRSGGWRGVIYTEASSGDQYLGWIPNSAMGTDAGGDTLIDGGKNWGTNILVGATVTLTGSPNKELIGKTNTVAGNTTTTLTFTTGFGATVPSGTTYETRQPKTTVRLTDGAYCSVDFDASGISVGAIGAETPVYQVAATLATGSRVFGPMASVEVGLGRKLFLASGDSLILDGPSRRASIVTAGDPANPRILTDPAVSAFWHAVDEDGILQEGVRSARWLPLVIGQNQLTNGGAETGSLAPWVATPNAGVTGTVTTDATHVLSGSKAFKFNITANTNGGSFADLLTLEYPKFAVTPGQIIRFAGAFWGAAANLIPQLGIRWYDAVGLYLAEWRSDLTGVTANARWTPSSIEGVVYDPNGGFAAGGSVSPVNAAQASVFCALYGKTANVTGTAWFDALDYGSPILFYSEVGANQVNVAAAYRPGWLS